MDIANLKIILEHVGAWIISDSAAKIVSLIGTLVSLYVGYTVRDIKKRTLFTIRAPKLCTDLSKHASRINELLNDFIVNQEEIITEVSLSLEVLKDLRSKSSGLTKTSLTTAKKVLIKFRKAEKSKINREMVREVYTQLLVSHRAVRNEINDRKVLP